MSATAAEGKGRYPPVALLVDPLGLPVELKARACWVVWRFGPTPPRGKPEKVPLNPRTGRKASSTDPRTWGRFEDAYARYLDRGLHGRGGVGFVLPLHALTPPAGRLAGLDLDGYRDPASGRLDPDAADALGHLDTYCEVSPSGTGVKAVAFADLDRDGPKVSKKGSRRKVELYPEARFFALTGWRVPGFPAAVKPRGEQLADLRRLLLPPVERAGPVPADRGPGFGGSDESLLAAALAAANGDRLRAYFHRGEFGGHPTPSEALFGLAQLLAFWTGDDPDRADRLIRRSALWRRTEDARPKWDSKRRGSTWGMRYVVEPAIATCRAFYGGARAGEQTPDPRTQTVCKHGVHFTTLTRAWERAAAGEFPPGAEVIDGRDRHTQAGRRGLAALCWHLAGRAVGGRFYLAEADAAGRLGVARTTVNRWLVHLRGLRIIRRLRPGNSLAGVASEYQWLGLGAGRSDIQGATA